MICGGDVRISLVAELARILHLGQRGELARAPGTESRDPRLRALLALSDGRISPHAAADSASRLAQFGAQFLLQVGWIYVSDVLFVLLHELMES